MDNKSFSLAHAVKHTSDLSKPFTFAVAPMMKWTDRHCRFFHRLISRHTLLYTEMVSTGAILWGPRQKLLEFHPSEHPVALQIGGSEPIHLAKCAVIAEQLGYDEINLNIGCPSDRVQNGRFGACLMAEPELVAEGIAEMKAATTLPVTVKSRIGIKDEESYEELHNFIDTVAKAGCNTFIIHARRAILEGLSPRENREIPPLRYDFVQQIKEDFPKLKIILNGGIVTLDQAMKETITLNGVMMGREAYHNPYVLSEVDRKVFGDKRKPLSRIEIAVAFIPYVKTQLEAGVPLTNITRHILGLFHSQPGGRLWRRHLSEYSNKRDSNETIIQNALKYVSAPT